MDEISKMNEAIGAAQDAIEAAIRESVRLGFAGADRDRMRGALRALEEIDARDWRGERIPCEEAKA